jgi:isopenicillin N synthase-like dioxygenase
MSIEVIDYTQEDASVLFASSMLETGFAVFRNHPVSDALINTLYADWLAFFRSEDKYRFLFDEKTHAGYIPLERSETAKGADIKDLKEFYHYYPKLQCPDFLKTVSLRAHTELESLAHVFLSWIETALPQDIQAHLSMPLSHMIDDSTHTLLRVIHYPPIEDDIEPGAIRAAAHEDINLLTILPAATAKGLQVQTRAGDWLDVPCEAGWLIVNAGDMLAECTQGYFKATPHRVINPSCEYAKKSRVSSPLFLHPRDGVMLSERHTAASYRKERFKELGLLKEDS